TVMDEVLARSGEVSGQGAAGVLNLAFAVGDADADSSIAKRRAAAFLKKWPEKRSVLQAALVRRDAKGFQRTAHNLTRSLHRLGATFAAEASQKLEHIGKTGEVSSVSDAFSELDSALKALSTAPRNIRGRVSKSRGEKNQ